MAAATILAAAATVPGPQQPFVAAGAALAGVFGSLTGMSPANQKRTQQGITDLNAALNGDVTAASSLYDGIVHSVPFSQDICRKAWAIIQQNRPDIAAQVLAKLGLPPNTPAPQAVPGPSVVSPTQSLLDQYMAQIRVDTANALQKLGTGTLNAGTAAISPNAGTSVPFTAAQKNLLYVGLAVLAFFLLPKLLKSRG